MTSQFFTDARFFAAMDGASSGLTPYMETSLQEQNPFDAQYKAHGMSMNTPSTQHYDSNYNHGQGFFDPQVLGRSRSSADSNSSGQARGSSGDAKSSCSELVDEDNQELVPEYKRAKFLERNRLAAAKCRTKKKEWTNNLEAAARQASQQTRELQAIVQNLRDEVIQYKTQLLDHQNCNCPTINQYLMREHSLNLSKYDDTGRGYVQD